MTSIAAICHTQTYSYFSYTLNVTQSTLSVVQQAMPLQLPAECHSRVRFLLSITHTVLDTKTKSHPLHASCAGAALGPSNTECLLDRMREREREEKKTSERGKV